jgi:hypothetical protein
MLTQDRTYRKTSRLLLLLSIVAGLTFLAIAYSITHAIAHAATRAGQVAQAETSTNAVGEDLHIGAGEVVQGDATVTDGDMTVDGEVRGNVVVVQGDAYIHGKVVGDVSVMGGDAKLTAGSSVTGNVLVLAGGKVEREPGASICGEISTVDVPLLPTNASVGFPSTPGQPSHERFTGIFNTLGRVATLVLVLGLGLLLTVFVLAFAMIVPHRLQVSNATLEAVPGPSLAVGLIVALLLWPLFGIISMLLTLTVVGIVLVPVLGIIVALALLFGLANVSLWLGKRVYESVHLETRPLSGPQRTMLETLLGLGVVLAATLFPTLLLPGWISSLLWMLVYLAACVGTGAGVMSRFGTLVPPSRQPSPVQQA